MGREDGTERSLVCVMRMLLLYVHSVPVVALTSQKYSKLTGRACKPLTPTPQVKQQKERSKDAHTVSGIE
jgi:hypothetical protein